MKIFFSEPARREMDDAFAYLEQEQAGSGHRFAADVDAALSRIQHQPLAWHPLGRNLRRCHLKHFRYGVIYCLRGDQTEVLAIAHDSRRPEYWRERARQF